MGVDIDGCMVLGESITKIKLSPDIDDVGEWVDDNGMDTISPWYDSGPDNWVIGFRIKDVPVSKIDEKWLEDIRTKASKFEKLTGTKARLIGMQDVW